ncbi:MAG: pyridoxamine 5'-phosphate oxidase family protein [Patescibacteria group bacterium]
MDNVQVAKNIIRETIYAVLGTASSDGMPWISPVFFAYDDSFNIYWVSNKDSLHSQLLRENPEVAITIFDSRAVEGEGDAVYMRARVEELAEKEDIENGVRVFNARATGEDFKIKEISEVIGEGVWRIYKATSYETTKLGKGQFIHGQYVDMRIPISLAG